MSPLVHAESSFEHVSIWLEDKAQSLTRLEQVHFNSHPCGLEDVYSKIILIEGWTIAVDVVELQCEQQMHDWVVVESRVRNPHQRKRPYPLERSYIRSHRKLGRSPQGLYACIGLSSQAVYARLESQDQSLSSYRHEAYIGFLLSADPWDERQRHELRRYEKDAARVEKAMLLRPVSDCYERVGLFDVTELWSLDEDGQLCHFNGGSGGLGLETLMRSFRRIRLG